MNNVYVFLRFGCYTHGAAALVERDQIINYLWSVSNKSFTVHNAIPSRC